MARPAGHGIGFETRRQEIIDTAAALFARSGYAGIGIAEIGKEVGLGKGALYYYISSKENLLVEIQGRVLRPLLRSARRIDELNEAPVLKLRLLSETLLEMILWRLDHIWVYEHDYRHLQGENLSRFLRERGEFEAIVRSLLEAGMETGALRSMDPQLAALQFLNLHNHTYQWGHPGGEWDAARLAQEYCATLIFGLGQNNANLDELEEQVRDFRSRYNGPTLMAHDSND
jgi:AcrR family transcriptional regulator